MDLIYKIDLNTSYALHIMYNFNSGKCGNVIKSASYDNIKTFSKNNTRSFSKNNTKSFSKNNTKLFSKNIPKTAKQAFKLAYKLQAEEIKKTLEPCYLISIYEMFTYANMTCPDPTNQGNVTNCSENNNLTTHVLIDDNNIIFNREAYSNIFCDSLKMVDGCLIIDLHSGLENVRIPLIDGFCASYLKHQSLFTITVKKMLTMSVNKNHKNRKVSAVDAVDAVDAVNAVNTVY